MTTLWDQTIQHQGWRSPVFADAGWQDFIAPSVTGLPAGSFHATVINGTAIDMELRFTETDGTDGMPTFLRIHSNQTQDGLVLPQGYVVRPTTRIVAYTRTSRNTDAALWRFTISDLFVTPPPTTPACQYGTQPTSSAPGTVIITDSLISAALAAVDMSPLVTLFAPLVGLAMAVDLLCGSQPPQMPPLDSNPSLNSLGELLQAFKAVSWPYFCECSPGTPAPINFPPPVANVSGTPPAPIVWPCDPVDTCANISEILRQIGNVQQQVASNYALTTLLQRYRLPFALVPGAMHTGLTGAGSFAVSRLIGIGVNVTKESEQAVSLPGVPTYIKNLGWIGISAAGVSLAERRIARSGEVWLPEQMAIADHVGWDLVDGATVNLREMQAET